MRAFIKLRGSGKLNGLHVKKNTKVVKKNKKHSRKWCIKTGLQLIQALRRCTFSHENTVRLAKSDGQLGPSFSPKFTEWKVGCQGE